MFIHMLTVECTNRLCSNMSNTIQHCSLRCKGHKIIIICIIMHHCTCPVTIQGLLICLILILICHYTQWICYYANYKHMQQCLACVQIPAPMISYAGVQRSDLMGVLLSWECHNLLLSENVLMNIMLQLSGTNLHQNFHINISLKKQE